MATKRVATRIVVVVIRDVHIDEPELMELAQSLPCELGGAGQPDVAALVPIDEESTVIEPRLGHDDRRQCVRHKTRRKSVSTSDIVVARPIRKHLSIRNRAHRLWHKIPIAYTHRIPLTRIHEEVSMSPRPGRHTRPPGVANHLIGIFAR